MKKIALVFPGQGSQKIGMGEDLYLNHKIGKEVFNEIDQCLNEDLSKLIFNGNEKDLQLTRNTQPALLAVSMAIIKIIEFELKKKTEDFVEVVLGHSLGEYSALCSINCISLCSGANILRKRGDAMQNAVRNIETSMVAVIGMDLDIIEKEINQMNKKKNEICEIANDNCPGQVILSGTKGSVDFISQKLKSLGARSIIELNVSAPFHCSLMKNATMIMQDALSEVVIQKPKIKFINNVNAKFVYNPEEIKKLLVEQVQSRVRWRESIGEASRLNLDLIIEIGPGKVLTGLNKRMKVDAGYFNISTLEDINNFLKNYGDDL